MQYAEVQPKAISLIRLILSHVARASVEDQCHIFQEKEKLIVLTCVSKGTSHTEASTAGGAASFQYWQHRKLIH